MLESWDDDFLMKATGDAGAVDQFGLRTIATATVRKRNSACPQIKITVETALSRPEVYACKAITRTVGGGAGDD